MAYTPSLYEIENLLSAELAANRQAVIEAAENVINRPLNIHQFHAIIGRWNNDLVDCIRVQFSSPNDFLARWFKGLRDRIDFEIKKQVDRYGSVAHEKAIFRLLRLMQCEPVRDYTITFLTRNFYRQFKERVRAKPHEELWTLWFGENQLCYGLLIAPAFRNKNWTNDKSEIRRAKYEYWTVGHVLSTGLIDPDSSNTFSFPNLDNLIQFYRSVLRKISKSVYEKQIVDCYLNYLSSSANPLQEPFLIPEIRYAGLTSCHKYRLDFAVLNSHVMSYTGFEISPNSSHMAVKGTKNKLQKDINAEIQCSWTKEISKRNEFFSKFGITTVTFTGEALNDISSCFENIQACLSARSSNNRPLSYHIAQIESFDMSVFSYSNSSV